MSSNSENIANGNAKGNDVVQHINKANVWRTPQPRVTDPVGKFRHTGANQLRHSHEVIQQPPSSRPNSTVSLCTSDKTIAGSMNQLRDQAEREFSGWNATSDDGVRYDSRFKSGNLTHTVCRELDIVLFERDICQQGLACSDRASNQQFDDDESGSDPELVNLFRTNNSCPRRGHKARQAPPRLTPQNVSWSPRRTAYNGGYTNDVSTSSMVDRRLPEIPRIVQPIHLNEVRRFLDECHSKLDKEPAQSDQRAGPDLRPPRIRGLEEPILDPNVVHREELPSK